MRMQVAMCGGRLRWRTRKQRRRDAKIARVWDAIDGGSRAAFYRAIESSPEQIDGNMVVFDRNEYAPESLLCFACERGNLEAIAYLLSVPSTHTTYAKCYDHQQPLRMLQDYRHEVADILGALDLFARCPPERGQVSFKDAMVYEDLNALCYRLRFGSDIRVVLKCMAMGMYDAARVRAVKGCPGASYRVSWVEARQAVIVILAHESRTGHQLMPKEIWRLLLRMITH